MSSVSQEEPTTETGAPRSTSEADDALEPGTAIGRYLLVDRMGAGGMGEVYAAYDPELDRKVALKLVHAALIREGDALQARLLREAQALAKLSHPNVVAVYDAGTHECRVYIAMEFVEGETLTAWFKGQSRGWRSVLDVMLRAGRGLAAAHDEGLVHRDFKPGNVMVGADGRVRVLDFGIARRWEGEEGLADDSLDDALRSADVEIGHEVSGRSNNLATALTRTGTVLGTPSYMAPEQFAGKQVRAAADQFAFCVVAYRLLFGSKPFDGDKYDELSDNVLRGALRPPPRTVGVPWGVWSVLERGLARDPDDRFASMSELLDRLERVLRARRRRVIAVGAAIAVAAVGGLAWTASMGRPCESGGSLDGVWDASTRGSVRVAFEATNLPYAADAHASVTETLDAYADAYQEQRRDACAATQIRGEQSAVLMDLRMACLDRRRVELEAMVQLLARADEDIVENAVGAVERLDAPDACSDVERLTAPIAPPSDDIADAAAELEEELAALLARIYAGKFADSLDAAKAAQERARTIGYDPLRSRASRVLGATFERLGRPQETVAAYQDAVIAAARAGDRTAEARALLGLMSVLGSQLSARDEAVRLGAHARALVEAIGNPPLLASTVELYLGTAEYRAHDLERAEAHFRRALDLAGDLPETERVRMAARNNLAGVMSSRGQYLEALEILEAATVAALARLGPHHPVVAVHYSNVGVAYIKLQRWQEAYDALEKSLAVHEAAGAEISGDAARAYHNLGLALQGMRRYDEALEYYERAYEGKRRTAGEFAHTTAFSANNIGTALVEMGRPADAIPWLEKALQIWEKAVGTESPERVYALSSLADAHSMLGHHDAAIEYAEDGLALVDRHETEVSQRGDMRFVAAKVLGRAGRSRPRALELARLAQADFARSERPAVEELEALTRWLRDNG